MSKKYLRKKRYTRSLLAALKIVFVVVLIAAASGSVLFAWRFMHNQNTDVSVSGGTDADMPVISVTEMPTEHPTEAPTEPEPEHVVSRATIGATGDLLMHMPVINSGLLSDGSYNFDYIFKYLSEYTNAADFAVANLETTLAGSERAYSGYPNFNCPDEIVDGARNGGFDMLLTGNNHSYDTGEAGFFRTIETVRSHGLETLGTMLTADEPKYVIEDINGIKVGMISYTYQGIPDGAVSGRVYLNGIMLHEGAENVVNTFIPNSPESFYTEVEGYAQQMRAEGAEALVIFMHWGVEYTTTPVAHQTQIAQKLCDLGFDVIVGGHPHVVEPIALLSSTVDPSHKTVCLYSMGNAVSNQRASVMESQPEGYTEDGVWFTMTFCKYSDGTVYLEDVNLIPCWVNLRTTNGRYYYILPLDSTKQDNWAELLDLGEVSLAAATRSYNRTMGIVGDGLTQSKQYLADQQELRDANYLAAVTGSSDTEEAA
jgi:hypothetical protein